LEDYLKNPKSNDATKMQMDFSIAEYPNEVLQHIHVRNNSFLGSEKNRLKKSGFSKMDVYFQYCRTAVKDAIGNF